MRTPNVRLLLLAIVLVTLTRSLDVTASSPQTKPRSYVDVVELYRRGEDELALKQLGMLTDTDVRIGRDALLTDYGTARIRAAAVLHTVQTQEQDGQSHGAQSVFCGKMQLVNW